MYIVSDYIVSSLGFGTEENVQAMLQGRSGLSVIEDKSLCPDPVIAGRIDWSRVDPADGFNAAERLMLHCISQIRLKNPKADFTSDKFCLVLSTTKGNIDLLQDHGLEDKAVFLPEMADRVAKACGIRTKPVVISNACISGLSAIMVAQRLIDGGFFEHILVVGCDILSKFVIEGFRAFKSVSNNICRPYDKERDGLSMGEACGAVLFASKKPAGNSPAVCVRGAAVSNDANHISGPSRTGDGLFYAIRAALQQAALNPNDIDFISAHGTATVYNDEMESKAFALAGLQNTPLGSFKPYFGHTLGACGVIESILTIWQLRNSVILATPGYETCGTPHELNVSARHRLLPRSFNCLKTASGFAGCNAAIVFSIAGSGNDKPITFYDNRKTMSKMASVSLKAPEGVSFDDYLRDEYARICEPNIKFLKMDRMCKAAYLASEILLRDVELPEDRTRVAVVLRNYSASLDTDLRHQQILNAGEPASPAVFVYTLPNIACGEICIRHKINGENTFCVTTPDDNSPYLYACGLIGGNIADVVIYGNVDVITGSCEFELLT